jgi:hypothetical protein
MALASHEDLSKDQIGGTVNKDLLRFGFWCCIIEAIAGIPMTIMGVASGLKLLNEPNHLAFAFFNTTFQAVQIIICFVTIDILQNIIGNRRYSWIFYAYMILCVFSISSEFINIYTPSLSKVGGIFLLIYEVPLVIVFAACFYKMRKLATPFGKLWKRYCIINVIQAICALSIILSPIALLLDIVTSILLARIINKSLKPNFPSAISQ